MEWEQHSRPRCKSDDNMKETHTNNLPSSSSDLEKPTDDLLQNPRRLQNWTQLAEDAMARFLWYEYEMGLFTTDE